MRKRLFTFYAVLFGSINFLSAQITFQKTYSGTIDDYGYSAQQTIDGGYIITGYTQINSGGNGAIRLIKTDANGDTLWTKTFDGAGNEHGYSVQQTTDGGYIITGGTNSFGAGNYDVYLVKTDGNGDILWTKTFGGTSLDDGNCVQQTADGGYIIAGYTNSFGLANGDVYLIKTNSVGDTLWTKTFGGTGDDFADTILQTTDGGYIVTGSTNSFGAGSFDFYVINTDSIGGMVWSKTFGGLNYDGGGLIQQTTDGGYIIVGITSSFGAGNYDAYLIKTDASGDTLWTKTFGGANVESAGEVQQTTDGGYIIAGLTGFFGAGNYDIYLIKTNTIGDTIWTKTFGGSYSDFAYSIEQTADGGYAIAGYTYSFGVGNSYVYLVKTDSLGYSGCNEGNSVTIVSTTATQVTNPATIAGSTNTIVTTPSTIVGSGGIVNTLCITGINEITTNNLFIISPNPSSENFIISFEEMVVKGNVKISNIFGEDVFARNIFNESRKEINLKNISSGIYFVKVYDGKKNYCKKIIIEQD